MERFAGLDFFEIDALLSAEEKNCRQVVRDFVDQECMPIIAGHFDQGSFPWQLLPRYPSWELFGLHVKGFGSCRATRRAMD